jgi:type IV pilus assembly protein PilA
MLLQLRQKRKDKRGFTLMEMLIVVAIIAILVAVAIPVLNTNLETARESADSANERSAKTLAALDYFTNSTAKTVYFNAATGVIADAKAGIAAYGQGTAATGTNPSTATATPHTGEIVAVTIASNGALTTSWEAAA